MSEEMEFGSFAEIDEFLSNKSGELMDLNHEMIQFSRQQAQRIEGYHDRFQAICGQMYEAHAIGAKMFSDLTGDMIMDEFELEKVEDDDEDLREQ